MAKEDGSQSTVPSKSPGSEVTVQLLLYADWFYIMGKWGKSKIGDHLYIVSVLSLCGQSWVGSDHFSNPTSVGCGWSFSVRKGSLEVPQKCFRYSWSGCENSRWGELGWRGPGNCVDVSFRMSHLNSLSHFPSLQNEADPYSLVGMLRN